MKYASIVVAVIAAALPSGCSSHPNPPPNPTASEDASPPATALNAGPKREYPEFTLEAQKAAMQRIKELRKKTRVEGLRSKTPPADWIEIAYHGLVLDANLDVIVMDVETISKMQESMFEILYKAETAKAVSNLAGAKPLFYDKKFQDKDQLLLRTATLQKLLARADDKLRARYEWRHRLIHAGVSGQVDVRKYPIRMEIKGILKRYQVPDDFLSPPPTSTSYVEKCRAEHVPIPPNWPDGRWVSQGRLTLVLTNSNWSAEVLAYQDPAVPGVCYAFPRRDFGDSVQSLGIIQFLGIICESYGENHATGRACFWDNMTVDGAPIRGRDITLDIATIGNGWTLQENCTECHRGQNVFIVHPGSALDLQRKDAPGGPYNTDPTVWFTPIAQAPWSNPEVLELPQPPAGQHSCTKCHTLPASPGKVYCRTVLPMAALYTMPPNDPTKAGWPPDYAVNSSYADHIARLQALCASQ